MWAAMGRWMVLASCVLAAVSATQDNALRFLNHKETVRMAQQKHSDEVKVFASGFKGDLPMEKFRAQSTVCPNGITECPDSSTCCPLQDGQYGCCQGVNAVCCKDGVHCCPEGYKCDEQRGRCASSIKGISFQWVDKKVLRAQPVAQDVAYLAPNKTCPDNKTQCIANDTCCRAVKGFGCCPLPNAVCCSDLVHCCPMGTKCDMVKRRCYRQDGDQRFPWIERRPEKESHSRELSEVPSQTLGKKRAVICKDGLMCPDGNTCCLLQNGSYGCCPYSDKKQSPAALSAPVVCPGGQYECRSGETCCELQFGKWGCCPHPNANCCSDHIHCCPHGYTCQSTQCQKPDGQDSLPWSVKTPAVPREEEVMAVKCPDGSECANGNTCCLLLDGKYGCCPYSKAVCCKDKKHCCPNGYTCDVMAKTCNKSATVVPFLVQKAAVSNVQSVICPDGSSECPDGSTCCKMSTGQYGCCPQPNAVCCSDGIHCCPEGSTCDLAHQSCKKGQEFIPWVEKVPSPKRAQSVVCPGGQSECPDGNTCCKLTSGQYGCCPLPDAVCCSDGIHCCPQNTTCNLAKQTCDGGHYSIPWEKKLPARHSLP